LARKYQSRVPTHDKHLDCEFRLKSKRVGFVIIAVKSICTESKQQLQVVAINACYESTLGTSQIRSDILCRAQSRQRQIYLVLYTQLQLPQTPTPIWEGLLLRCHSVLCGDVGDRLIILYYYYSSSHSPVALRLP
jgi:hypothetical protein